MGYSLDMHHDGFASFTVESSDGAMQVYEDVNAITINGEPLSQIITGVAGNIKALGVMGISTDVVIDDNSPAQVYDYLGPDMDADHAALKYMVMASDLVQAAGQNPEKLAAASVGFQNLAHASAIFKNIANQGDSIAMMLRQNPDIQFGGPATYEHERVRSIDACGPKTPAMK
jgi:hypothetical protein